MYDASNRKVASEEMTAASAATDMSDAQVLMKAIELVKTNASEHRELIGRLAAAAQTMAGIQPITGLDERLKDFTDRSKTLV
jgi:hypothetical protein